MKLSSFLLLPLALKASALATPPSPSLLQPRLDLNDVLALISELFPVDVALDTASAIIAAADQALADLLSLTTTYNDLEDGDCGDVTLIFARGTDEPGNVGALVGPELYAALQTALGSYTLVFQGVNDYDASVTQYLEGGSTTGGSDM